MKHNVLETLVGAIVLAVAVGFALFAYQRSGVDTGGGYPLVAQFDSVDGLSLGADVRIAGIKVGTVATQTLDTATFRAQVQLSLRKGTDVPEDSTAAVVSDGLLGGKYVSISPGGSERALAAGEEIRFTQSAVNLEQLIGKMVFSGGGVDRDDGNGAAASPATATGSSLGLE